MSFRELRQGAVFLMSMAEFWKRQPTERFNQIMDDPDYRRLHFDYLARMHADHVVWQLGHNFFHGGLHGYPTDWMAL